MSDKYTLVSGVAFGVGAAVQALRALLQVPIVVGGIEVPIFASWVTAVVASGLCIWAFNTRHST